MSSVHEPLVAEPAEFLDRIPEAAIQDAWVRGLFDPSALQTTMGEPVCVLRRGDLNRDSGPDIADARIEIGSVLWAGDIEIHTTSRAWEAHGHHRDPAYDRVVLHVVLSPDVRTGTLRRADGSVLPELVLLPHLDRALVSLLRSFYLSPATPPQCRSRWDEVPVSLRRDWVGWLGDERLRARTRALADAYGRRPDLDRLLVARAFRALGYEPNADAFETLAGRLDLGGLRSLDGRAIHQLLLALSGLGDATLFESIPMAAHPMRREAWKRGGRPANAPLRRLAQAAAWLAPSGPFHLDPVATLAAGVQCSAHAALDLLRPPTPDDAAPLGQTRASRVLIDAVLPILLLDADQRGDLELEAAVFDVYRSLPSPSDRIVRKFAEAGLRARSAAQAQGIHQLVRSYCTEGRCARCAIGRAIYPALAEFG